MSRYWCSVLTTLLFSLGLSSSAVASPALPSAVEVSQNRNSGQSIESSGLFEKLNVSPQQKEEIQAIRDQHRRTLQQQQKQLKRVQQELNQLIASDASETQIRQKHDQLLQMTQKMQALNFDVMLQLREILTPEQREKFSELMQDRRIQPARNSRN